MDKNLRDRVEGMIEKHRLECIDITCGRKSGKYPSLATALCSLIESECVKAKIDREFLALICYSVWQDGNIDGWEKHKKETKHFGDCTNEPNTCHVCFTKSMYKLADELQSQLKDQKGEK